MEETTNSTQPQAPAPTKAGKGLCVTGFVISLVALVLWYIVNAAALLSAAFGGGTGLAGFWLVLSLLGLIFSAIGMAKAKKGNGKTGLGVAGLVIGIVATILSVLTIFWVKELHDKIGDAGKEMMNAFTNELKQAVDSVKLELDQQTAPADSTAH
ncbi:MAG: hypothetical protein ACXVPQ_05235 [Bacteroidia bacterium]